MDDVVSFNGCMINQEIIFNTNMNKLRPLVGDRECISLNTPTARCLLPFLQNCGKVISQGEFLAAVWEMRGVVVSQNTFYQSISLLWKSLVKAGPLEDIIIIVRQKGFSVAPNTLVTPLSDGRRGNMNRVILTHYQNNKAVGFISEDKEKPGTRSNFPLIENSSNHGNGLMANKMEEGEKASEWLHATFKIPIWLVALIVTVIITNTIVLVASNR